MNRKGLERRKRQITRGWEERGGGRKKNQFTTSANLLPCETE